MKKNQKLALLAAVMLAGTTLLTGCANKEQSTEVFQTATPIPAAAQQEPQAPLIDKAVPVLARVNGRAVEQTEVDQVLTNLMSVYSSYGYDVSDVQSRQILREIALNYVIEMTMLDIKADEWGIPEIEGEELAQLIAEQHAEYESVLSYYMETVLGVTASSPEADRAAAHEKAVIAAEGFGYTEEARLAAAIRDARREKVQAEMVKDVTVTDEEIQAAYEARVSENEAACKADPVSYISSYEMTTTFSGAAAYYVPEGYRGVQQIVLPVDMKLLNDYQDLSAKLEEQVEKQLEGDAAAADGGEAVTQEQVEAAEQAILDAIRPTYDEIVARLEAGASFLELVDEYNIDPGMKSADKRENGYSVHMDSVVYDPAFIKAAFDTKAIGEISRPVVGSYGVYVAKYLRDVPAGPVAMNDHIRGELMEKLLAEREEQTMTDTMKAWMDAATVEKTDEGSIYLAAGN